MLVELPLWGIILVIILPLIIGFIIFKMVGLKILYAIALSLIVPVILVLILHVFDVVDGKLVPHVGDFTVATFLVAAILYWVILALYVTIYHLSREYCCKATEEETMKKMKEAYGNEVSEPILPSAPVSDKLEKPDETPPIDIIIFNDDISFDKRNLAGSLVSTSAGS